MARCRPVRRYGWAVRGSSPKYLVPGGIGLFGPLTRTYPTLILSPGNWPVICFPKPRSIKKVATGFLRNNTTSNEGGLIDEDYRVKYLVDRVNTTATAFLGLTLECAQCHDHKFDPMTQKEYYQFAGFFNNLVGKGNTQGATAPTVKIADPQKIERIEKLDAEIEVLDRQLSEDTKELMTAFDRWREGIRKKDTSGDTSKQGTTSKVLGRFVRVELPKDVDQFLTLSEVQVFSSGQNIAPQGQPLQSSDYGAANQAGKAIDGNSGGAFGSCSCTKSEKGGVVGVGSWPCCTD